MSEKFPCEDEANNKPLALIFPEAVIFPEADILVKKCVEVGVSDMCLSLVASPL